MCRYPEKNTHRYRPRHEAACHARCRCRPARVRGIPDSASRLVHPIILGYIYTHLDRNYHNHRGLVALSQSVELIVTSSTPDSEISGGRGDAQEPVGGWMMVHLKSQGTPRQDSVDFSGLLRHVICLREKKNLLVFNSGLLSET